jgi:hypothetical protein
MLDTVSVSEVPAAPSFILAISTDSGCGLVKEEIGSYIITGKG